MTHMKLAGGYVKQIWLVLGWAKGWQVKTIQMEQTVFRNVGI
jgi:hypothetical protein